MTKLDPIRRIVTGHSDEGDAIFLHDSNMDTTPIPGGDAEFCLLWTAPNLPVDNNDATDGAKRDAGLTLHGGSVIRVVDVLPGKSSPMHRTNSLDYGIVISGEVELELDKGVCKRIGPGGIIVQRGTMHLWRNPSESEICRIIFVLTEATAAEINGEALPEVNA